MANILDALAQYLVNNITVAKYGSYGLVLGQNLFLGRLPAEAPNASVLVQPYPGRAPSLTMGIEAIAIDNLKIQLLIRGEPEDYPDTYAWADTIRTALASIVGTQVIDGIHILRMAPLGTISPMPYDDGNRPKFTINFEANVQ